MLVKDFIAKERVAFINIKDNQYVWSDWVLTKKESKQLEKLAKAWKKLSPNHRISVVTKMLRDEEEV